MKKLMVVSLLALSVLAFSGAGSKLAVAAGGAEISGKITLSSAAPAAEKIKMAADPVCLAQHKDAVVKQDVVAKGSNLQYVLVYLDGVTGSYPAPASAVKLDQVGCMYEPHVFAAQVGQKVEISNSDATLHNVNCQAKSNKKFNLAQPTKGMKTAKVFDQPELAIPLKCNVHPWMMAWGNIFSHPFFAVTGPDGSYSIKGVPAGKYTLKVWQEKLGTKSQEVTVADGETKSVNLSL
jgi:plastocyanin